MAIHAPIPLNTALRAICVIASLCWCANARSAEGGNAEDRISGPVSVDIVRVVDGDTVIVDARTWPGHSVRVAVRLHGIDTPELRSRCPQTKAAALRAKQALSRLVYSNRPLRLYNVSGGKYYGRVLAELDVGGTDAASFLLERHLASPYRGGKRVQPACEAEAERRN